MAAAPTPIPVIRTYENAGARIHLDSRPVSWNELNNGRANYSHWIAWEADNNCPPGFLAQKVKRDIKYSFGRLSTSGATYSWNWGVELTERAEYWEIWEVVVPERNRVRIYPAARSTRDGGGFATSHGVLTREALKLDTNKRPPASPANLDYEAHDVFEERHPDPSAQNKRAAKGRFKIKGSVFFLPSGERLADAWVDRYFQSARRNMTFGTHNDYTGGPLWQNNGNFAKPDSTFRIMTRFEAGEFYHVTAEHLQVGPLTPPITNRPEIRSEWKERVYPLHRWQTYP
jgi:hypothetical protein